MNLRFIKPTVSCLACGCWYMFWFLLHLSSSLFRFHPVFCPSYSIFIFSTIQHKCFMLNLPIKIFCYSALWAVYVYRSMLPAQQLHSISQPYVCLCALFRNQIFHYISESCPCATVAHILICAHIAACLIHLQRQAPPCSSKWIDSHATVAQFLQISISTYCLPFKQHTTISYEVYAQLLRTILCSGAIFKVSEILEFLSQLCFATVAHFISAGIPLVKI